MVKKPIEDVYPLSPMQQGMLFHTLYAPKAGAYFIQVVCDLPSDLNSLALRQAWQEVINRHTILRTAFNWERGREPFQVVYRNVGLPFELYDWSMLSVEEQQRSLDLLLKEDRAKGFNLSKPPLMRVSLVQLSDSNYRLIWSIHHLLIDGWSLSLIFKDVTTFYEAFKAGQTIYLPQPRPYKDYIAWLQQQDLGKAETFWRNMLKGFTSPTSLNFGQPTNKLRDEYTAYAEQEIRLSSKLTSALNEFVKEHLITLNTVIQGAWSILLSRYSGEQDVLFGTTVSGRPASLKDVESMIGLFINSLPVRVNLSTQQLLPWLKDLHKRQVEQREFEYTPLSQVQKWSDIPHGDSLFESLLVFENYPVDASFRKSGENGSKQVQSLRFIEWTNYPITLIVKPGNELGFEVSYNRGRFEPETISRMLWHLQTILEGMLKRPNQCLADIPLITQAEQQRLTFELNNPEADYSRDICLHQIFESQVENFPEKIALTFGAQSLTYKELNQRANQLAHYLINRGVGPETRVAICMDRSFDMLVGILAILKAGGAYVPIDLSYPPDRIAFMLEDSKSELLLLQHYLLEKVQTIKGSVVYIDRDWESIALESKENVVSRGTTHNLAYVIYTSGSTGRPKGVQVSHSNVLRLFDATEDWFDFNETDVWTLFHSYAFDFSVWEIWGALLYGGRLVIIPYLVSRNPEAFYKLLSAEKVTVLNQTPSAFRQLIRAEDVVGMEPLRLRFIIFGGEALELLSLRPWFDRHGDAVPELVNMYGITETTVHVTYRPIKLNDLEENKGSVIGRTIPDLQIYILDQHMQMLPVGVAGEMFVGGDGLSRGYLYRPDLTADRFRPNPFSLKEGSRLYRTGDLARYLPDGDIEYLGRIDHQVKIRGFRIELGEIESAINSNKCVRESVVTVREDNNEKSLVAYIVLNEGQSLTSSNLRDSLKDRLPEYMVPSSYLFLDTIPLTSNGKVDYKSLPVPGSSRPELSPSFISPRTLEEEVLALIWEQVLKIDKVGIHDNFFELGGDSILSIQVIARAKESGLPLSLQQLFQYPTIYELTRQIRLDHGNKIETAGTEPFSLISEEDRDRLPEDVEDAYPLSRLQAGMLFHSEYDPDSSTYHNVTSFQIEATFDERAIRKSISQLINQHPVLRTSFNLSSYREPLQLVHKEVVLPLLIEDLRHIPTNEQKQIVSSLIAEEQRKKFNWNRPPLLRFHIHRLNESSFQLTLTEHHSILDGWSVAMMLSELFNLYFSLTEEKELYAGLPQSSSFRDFIALERQSLQSEESQIYWSSKLENSIRTVLPKWPLNSQDHSIHRIERKEVSISKDISEGLKHVSRLAGVPLKSVLLAIHLKVLSVVCNQEDVITGLVSNGRVESEDGDRVLGLFLNTVPLRLNTKGGTWLDLTKSTFQAEREMLPFRRYPLAELQRKFGNQPLFEAVFNFVHFHVYEDVVKSNGLELLSSKAVQETNYSFATNFSLDTVTSKVGLNLDYDVTELSSDQIEAISEYYRVALLSIVNNPHIPHDFISLLPEQEKDHLLLRLNDTEASYSLDRCIHELFEARVDGYPDLPAILFHNEQLTYRELDEKANQLAHYLHTYGVGLETPVGVCLDRSINLVVAFLGILKAGAVYVPMDPSYPRDRLAFMLEDARIKFLLTEESVLSLLPQHSILTVCMDRDWQVIEQEKIDRPTNSVSPDNLAYIIYTSGSTGRPKGTMIAHRGLSNLSMAQAKTFNIGTHSSGLQISSISFDASIFEMVMCLLSGANLCIADRGLLPGIELIDFLQTNQVSTITISPSLLSALPYEPLPKLTNIIVAGEACPSDIVKLWSKNHRFFNAYGPTEATIWSTVFECKDSTGKPPIGYPIANVSTYILSDSLQPVPTGTPGELYIGGVGLARGYYNRPDLTAERFIPNPFSTIPGERLYKTGDIARYLPDGTIDYLGRIDHQVKIRGFRVELEEIEAVLRTHPKVRESAVSIQEVIPGDKRLVAYYVAKDESPTFNELRVYLQKQLPDYMVPAAFKELDSFPLSPSGKLERRLLPSHNFERPQLEKLFVSPRSDMEMKIAKIWQETIGIDDIGIHDNFFELGGHSLLAIQLITKLRETFQLEIPLRTLYENPSVAQLATAIVQRQAEELEVDSLNKILAEMDQLSDEEVQRLLTTKG
jgi:amino acid adenylation domain-containing protein